MQSTRETILDLDKGCIKKYEIKKETYDNTFRLIQNPGNP